MLRRILIVLVLTVCVAVLFSPGGAQAQAKDYLLGPGDVLSIVIWGAVHQTYSVTVGLDGTFELPLIGKVVADGKTQAALASELKELFAHYIKEPNVIVNLTRAREIRVQIIGFVRVPGLYSITAQTSLSQALARAGGITEKGDPSAISIQRASGETTTVDLRPLLTGEGGHDAFLQDGDTIVVPLGVIRVAVIGEVSKPGVYEVPRNARLMDALMAAGGPTRQSITKKVTIYQAADLNQPEPKGIEIFKGDFRENPALQEGYVIYVPRNLVWDIGLVVSLISVLTGLKSLFGL